MLTPLDIHNKEFKRGLRGYDVDEVDGFLDEVIKDFEMLYKDNLDLKEQLKKYEDSLKQYKDMEETLQNTMVLAQRMAEESQKNAEKESELIIWEARKKAEDIVRDAYDQVTDCTRSVKLYQAYEKQLKTKLKIFIQSQLELIDNDSIEDLTINLDNKTGFSEEIIKGQEVLEKESSNDVVMECDGD